MALVKQERHSEQRAPERRSVLPRSARLPIISLLLGLLSCAGMLISIWLIFMYAPLDANQGIAQKIFYFHVPIAWIGMLAFAIMAGVGVAYLIKPNERLDWTARASAEVGAIFLTIALILGSIWGKTTWGTWWAWDAKLTATLILWFMYIAYLMLYNYMGRTAFAARAAAVLAIVGAIDVPIIYESVNWWRTLHPSAQVGTADGALPPAAILTLLISLLTFTLLYSFLMVQVYQLQRLQTLSQRLRVILE